MNIVVLVKQVPDTEADRRLNPADNTVDRAATLTQRTLELRRRVFTTLPSPGCYPPVAPVQTAASTPLA